MTFCFMPLKKLISEAKKNPLIEQFLSTSGVKKGGRWVSNPRPPEPQSGALTS